MHFSKKLYDEEEGYEILECTKLDNNILIYKEKLDENQHYVVKLKGNQYAMIFEKGKIHDAISEEGIYTINFQEPNTAYPVDFNDYIVKENKDSLCVLFFNMNIITGNHFYIKKKHNTDFYGEGTFDFVIENPVKFFNEVIQIKTFYSREELLERIRERISKIVTAVIKENKTAYIIDEDMINSAVNIFKNYGIKIISSNINDIKFKKK